MTLRSLSTALPLPISALMVLCSQVLAQPTTTINFDNLIDSTTVTNQFQGLTFQNAAVISAGISLNEFEFPPHSGSNVVYDARGPVTISFSAPIQSFAGYFTYSVPLTIQAFGSSGNQVVATSSRFFSNEALAGVAGSSPNELIQVSSGDRISNVLISGAATGTSFVLDDVSVSTATVCNLSLNGNPTAADVQLIINEALGWTMAADDLNGDGQVNVVDAQIVINAALGMGCSGP